MPDHIFDWIRYGKSLKLSEGDSAFLKCAEFPAQFLARHRDIGACGLLASRLHVSSHEPVPQRYPAFLGLWDRHPAYTRAYLEGGPPNRIGRLCAVASIASSPYFAHCRSHRSESSICLDKPDAELPLDVGNGSAARSGGLAVAFASPSL